MKFEKGDIVTIAFPLGFKSSNDLKEKYDGSVHEVLEIDDMGWVKLDKCHLIHWWPPSFIFKSTDDDEEIELQDLLSIM